MNVLFLVVDSRGKDSVYCDLVRPSPPPPHLSAEHNEQIFTKAIVSKEMF